MREILKRVSQKTYELYKFFVQLKRIYRSTFLALRY